MWNPFKRQQQDSADAPEQAPLPKLSALRSVADHLPAIGDVTVEDGGLENLVTAMGTSRDKATHTRYRDLLNLTSVDADNVYRASGLARKINNIPADDMFREWIDFSWDGSGDHPNDVTAVKDALTALNVRWQMRSCKRWSRLYGGAAMVMGVGEEDLSQPFDENKMKKGDLRWVHHFDRYRLIAIPSPLTADPTSPNYSLPNMYQLMAPDGSTPQGTAQGYVHWTRVIRFDGEEVPWFKFRQNGYWHDSTLLSILETLKGYDTATSAITTMLFDANVDIMKSKGLIANLAAKGGAAVMQNRYATGAFIKSLYRFLIIDKDDEEYDRKAYAFGGLADIKREYRTDLAAESHIPVTKLFGTSAQGLNATGEGDQSDYYDEIKAKQEAEIRPGLTRLLKVIIRSTLGTLPTGLKIDFCPLWQMTEQQRADVEQKRAQRDSTYLTAGVITPGLVAKQLHEDNVYSQMEDEDVKLAEELSEADVEPEDDDATPGPAKLDAENDTDTKEAATR
jgi:phage-related protein (TIGR01555 family)